MRRSVGCLGVAVAGVMMLGWCVGKITETTTPPAATTAPVATPPTAPTDETVAQELVDAAKARGGTDNSTVVIVQVN